MKNYVYGPVEDFVLSQTLECGQCFHFVKTGDEEYLVAAMGRILHIRQDGSNLIFYDTSEEEFNLIWKKYFDLERNYGEIKRKLLKADSRLSDAINSMYGVRILNQDFFETMISFIISQNQQIPRIKQIVANISREYGKRGEGIDIFPDVNSILEAGNEGMIACKAGFRSKYIVDACEKYKAGLLNEEFLLKADYETAVARLKEVKGIGDKVANCIALFSLNKRNAFPVDVWMKRIMENMYFKEDTPVNKIEAFAKEHFGELGGYAQQYLFYYGKTMNIGK